MRMHINSDIDSTVSNQISVFADKGTVQHGIHMLRSNHPNGRLVVCKHHNMGGYTFLDAFQDKLNTGLVHPVELLRLQQLPVELDQPEVVHAFPHEILVVRIDPRPQRTQNELGVIDGDDLTLIVANILPEHPPPIASTAPSCLNRYNIRGCRGQSTPAASSMKPISRTSSMEPPHP